MKLKLILCTVGGPYPSGVSLPLLPTIDLNFDLSSSGPMTPFAPYHLASCSSDEYSLAYVAQCHHNDELCLVVWLILITTHLVEEAVPA